MTQLALFDLDHTLLPFDSDYEWGQFLVRQGVVDAVDYAQGTVEGTVCNSIATMIATMPSQWKEVLASL